MTIGFIISGIGYVYGENLPDRIERFETSDELGIEYNISGAQITDIFLSRESNSVLISIYATHPGSLVITFPREVIDATIDGMDESFFILVDGEEVDYTETKTDIDRTLTIEFLTGTQEIEVVGTFAVPEFGTLTILILVIAIVSAIAILSQSKLSTINAISK